MTTDRGPCQAPAQAASEYCYFHDPAIADRRAEASARGGRTPRGGDLTKALERPETLDDPMRIAALLESMIEGAISGRVPPTTLRSVTYACRTVLAALEAGDVDRRLQELEATVKSIEEGRIRVPR